MCVDFYVDIQYPNLIFLLKAFVSVEQGWFESIDDALAEKIKLQMDLPEVKINELSA